MTERVGSWDGVHSNQGIMRKRTHRHTHHSSDHFSRSTQSFANQRLYQLSITLHVNPLHIVYYKKRNLSSHKPNQTKYLVKEWIQNAIGWPFSKGVRGEHIMTKVHSGLDVDARYRHMLCGEMGHDTVCQSWMLGPLASLNLNSRASNRSAPFSDELFLTE